jgi:hypothetical protein
VLQVRFDDEVALVVVVAELKQELGKPALSTVAAL